jgi:hypothetical protein
MRYTTKMTTTVGTSIAENQNAMLLSQEIVMRLIQHRLAGVFAVAALAMPLSARAAPDQSVSGSQQATQMQMTRVHHACTVIMGLDDPGELYDICVNNLMRSLRELEQARLVSTDRRTCRNERLEVGTPAFADCVLDAQQPSVYRGQ